MMDLTNETFAELAARIVEIDKNLTGYKDAAYFAELNVKSCQSVFDNASAKMRAMLADRETQPETLSSRMSALAATATNKTVLDTLKQLGVTIENVGAFTAHAKSVQSKIEAEAAERIALSIKGGGK
uniref:Phasin domain-containing protein n=1 Tax=Caulobacter sp. (strain K31) TaxID=366602 RepID=B0T624_CAUSK